MTEQPTNAAEEYGLRLCRLLQVVPEAIRRSFPEGDETWLQTLTFDAWHELIRNGISFEEVEAATFGVGMYSWSVAPGICSRRELAYSMAKEALTRARHSYDGSHEHMRL